jgi:membrane protease YdiL (CAAX protease family)
MMDLFRKYSAITEAAICSFAFMLFAFFVRYEFPLNLLAVIALILPSYFISRNLNTIQDIRKVTGGIPSPKLFILFSVTGITGGVAFAIMYRWHLDAPLVPQSIQWFAATAALIGCMEELVFRGYLQDSVKSYGPLFSVSFSTLSHTAYKCCLFLSPMAMMKVDVWFLALWTIIAGSIFGIIRHLTKSIIPSLVAHAIFDIWVYGEFANAPWWVW